MATYSAETVAAEIRRRLPDVATKKLHKLLYYCQGHHLGSFGEPIFSESIQAWDRGPVVASLWRDEKYGSRPVESPPLGQAELNTVGYVVSRYGAMTGADLESLTHSEPPWQIADARRRRNGDQRMELEEIRAYFARPVAAERAADDDEMYDAAEDYEPSEQVLRAWLRSAQTRRGAHLHRDNLDALDELARK